MSRETNDRGERIFEKRLSIYEKDVFEYLKDNSCPYVPRVYDFREENSFLIVKEEYIVGDTLTAYVKRNSVSYEEKLNIVEQVCKGLEFLHSAPTPIIHRDIKSDNIMVDRQGIVRILDYDAAKTYKKGRSRDTVLIGTEGVAAPEQYGFGQSDPRTDVYGVGKLLVWLFPGDEAMTRVAQKATMIDPAGRYQSIRELREALRRETRRARFRDGIRRYRGVAGVLLACVAVCVFVISGVRFLNNAPKIEETESTLLSDASAPSSSDSGTTALSSESETSDQESSSSQTTTGTSTEDTDESTEGSSEETATETTTEETTHPPEETTAPPEQTETAPAPTSETTIFTGDLSEILSSATLSPTPVPTTPSPTPTPTPTPIPDYRSVVNSYNQSGYGDVESASYSEVYNYLLANGASPEAASFTLENYGQTDFGENNAWRRLERNDGLSPNAARQMLTNAGFTESQIAFAMQDETYFTESARDAIDEMYYSNREITYEEVVATLSAQGYSDSMIQSAMQGTAFYMNYQYR